MVSIEVNSQRISPSLYKEVRGAITFKFDLHGGERIVVVTFDSSHRPIAFTLYTAKATPANQPFMFESSSGRALTPEEKGILSESDLFKMEA